MPAGEEYEPLDYARTSPVLIEHLEKLKGYAIDLGMEPSVRPIEEMLKRLRDHRFTVAVVGEFKTGKSTFVNALLGVDVLPTDVIPATATLNRIRYGMDQRIEAVYRDGKRVPVPFGRLAEYVTKEFVTEEMLRELEEVIVYHNAPFLMNNVDVIDTPGLNDDDAMTGVTLSVLPKIDAAILVISALSPFSEYTRKFLEERLLSSDLGRVIFVVNRIGQMGSAEEADRIIAHVEKRILNNVLERAKSDLGEDSQAFKDYRQKIGRPRIYGMDSRKALSAQLGNDANALEDSRYPALRQALRSFLNSDRGHILLQVPVNRALGASSEILVKLDMFRNAAGMRLEDFQAKRDRALAELDGLNARKERELAAVEQTAAEALEGVRSRLTGVESRIWEGVYRAVKKYDLKDQQATSKVGGPILDGVAKKELGRVAEREMELAAREISRNKTKVDGQIERFNRDLEDTIKRIALDFAGADSRGAEMGMSAASGVVALISIPAAFGGYAGYKQGGMAGAVTGIAATFTASTALLYTAAVLGMAVSLPLLVGASIAGFFAGDKLTKMLFEGHRAESFKDKALEQIEREIRKLNIEAELQRRVAAYAAETFGKIKDSAAASADAAIENMRNTLAEINEQKTKEQTVSGETLKRYEKIAASVTEIQNHAVLLNGMLMARAGADA